MLLLPADWRRWTDDERHAVLAHEIEHVRRRDFAAWMGSQIGVALHFYHPLVHWLASRLRLQQELAADAAAARVVGGQRKYVATLAAMALRQADESIAWPARAFLPNSKTFLRRIDMLHRSKSLRGDVSRPAVFVSVAGVLLAAVCAAGIRGSAAGEQVVSSSSSTEENGVSSAGTAVVADQAEQQKSPVDKQRKANEALRQQRRDVNNLERIALALHNYYSKNGHFPPAVVTGPDGKTPHSWRVELLPYLDAQPFFDRYQMNEPWDSETNKKVLAAGAGLFRSPFDDPVTTDSGYYVFVGPGTMFEGKNGIKFQDVTDGTSNTILVVGAKRGIPWTKPEDISFHPDQVLPEVGGFVKGQFTAALGDGHVRVYDTEKVKDQLKWLIMRNDQNVIDVQKLGPDPRHAHDQANEARRQTQRGRMQGELNNVKLIALAMHNYYDLHKHFPTAVVMGPDGKTPHSWRVELLPFLDAKALYDRYQMNEPWDSETNKKVLAAGARLFRSPFDEPASTNSEYYVLVGPGTMFEGKDGITFQDVTDGTSNTLLVVQAKRSIPWTTPEDIPFDPEKPLPELGGFVKGQFLAALADGSARVYDNPNSQLKWLIMRNDGHVIDSERLLTDSFKSKFSRSSSQTTEDNPVAADPAHQTMQNLKHLTLAMHNYHDIHGHFPPAVVMGPDCKTPHSWRVELLPLLDLKGLYDQYKMNEPWDSLTNLKVLAQMPDVFRSPYRDPKSANSGYFAIVGRGTVFEGFEGVKIRDITDGTSNTLMLVESKRNIPWTKPEDIAFDPDKGVPDLGGLVEGMLTVATADGAVHRIETERIKDQLKWLIMRNDGHPIEWR